MIYLSLSSLGESLLSSALKMALHPESYFPHAIKKLLSCFWNTAPFCLVGVMVLLKHLTIKNDNLSVLQGNDNSYRTVSRFYNTSDFYRLLTFKKILFLALHFSATVLAFFLSLFMSIQKLRKLSRLWIWEAFKISIKLFLDEITQCFFAFWAVKTNHPSKLSKSEIKEHRTVDLQVCLEAQDLSCLWGAKTKIVMT